MIFLGWRAPFTLTGHEDNVFQITSRLWLGRLQSALGSILGSLYRLQHLIIGAQLEDTIQARYARARYELNKRLPSA